MNVPGGRAGAAATGLARLRRPNPVYSDAYRSLIRVFAAARRRARLSQRDLARALGKSSSHIARIEAGQRRIDVLELCAVAEALGLRPEALFREMVETLEADRTTPPA